MKNATKFLRLSACALGVLALAANARATEYSMGPCCSGAAFATIAQTSTNAIPDLLPTCPVSGDKLDGDMGAPFVFVYKGQEVKLCCKSCKKDFDKNPDKYLKLIRAADKKAKKP